MNAFSLSLKSGVLAGGALAVELILTYMYRLSFGGWLQVILLFTAPVLLIWYIQFMLFRKGIVSDRMQLTGYGFLGVLIGLATYFIIIYFSEMGMNGSRTESFIRASMHISWISLVISTILSYVLVNIYKEGRKENTDILDS